MTTIATDGLTMSADTLVTCGHERVAYAAKIASTPDGRVFGSSGTSVDGQLFERWMIEGGERPDLSEDFSALVLTTEGEVYYLCEKLEPVQFNLPQAIGSGADLAIGAMLAGASAEDAVRIAIQRDTNSGGEITTIRNSPIASVREVA